MDANDFTDVRITLAENPANDRILGYATVVVRSGLLVNDIKIIQGYSGHILCMPSREVKDRCPKCNGKNRLLACYCNWCGQRLPEIDRAGEGKPKVYIDVVHPISRDARQLLEMAVFKAFEEALRKVDRGFGEGIL